MHQRRRRRMERRASEPARQQQRRKHDGGRRGAHRAQHQHRDHRPTHQEHARPPSIGERAEAELRDRARELVTHRQHADRLERQAQLRDQQRQQRREHVAVRVDDEVRGRRGPYRRVQSQTFQRRTLRKRPSTMWRASSNSCSLTAHAATESTASADHNRAQDAERVTRDAVASDDIAQPRFHEPCGSRHRRRRRHRLHERDEDTTRLNAAEFPPQEEELRRRIRYRRE